MKKGLVSVVIPMYNAEHTIARAINSALMQTYRKFEVIVVDDGSTDRSLAVVKEIAAKKDAVAIRLIVKKNGGVSSARNAGMCAAKGEFIAFLDADDEWVREKIATQIDILNKHPNVSFVGSMVESGVYSRFVFKKISPLQPISLRDQIFKNYFPTPTVVIRGDVVGRVGYFDESQRYAEEGNYWIRILAHYKALLIAKPLVLCGDGKPSFGHSGLSGNLREMERGELKNICYAHSNGLIGPVAYIAGVIFSLAKYVRRIILVSIRRAR